MAETSKGQTSKGQTSKGLAAAGGAGPADAAAAVLPVQGQAIGGLSFEEALAELEAIVQKLERGASVADFVAGGEELRRQEDGK